LFAFLERLFRRSAGPPEDDRPVKLIVGLGNPGREYEKTRHNVGWWVVDHLADVWHFGPWKRDGEALTASGSVHGARVRLMKPQTFMNLSGSALRPYLRRPFWSAATDLLVVVDDVALPVGRYRLRARGSAGGHNGLKSIEGAIGGREYPRLRIGISDQRSAAGGQEAAEDSAGQRDGPLRDFVLGKFGRRERAVVTELMPRCTDAIETWLADGIDRAMSFHNAPQD
jgi:PTH1 family peptidyl-tRNA hydrolase